MTLASLLRFSCFPAVFGLFVPCVDAAAPFARFADPHPAPGNQFGAAVVVLSTGNVVITSPFSDFNGPDTGSVYLFNGATGELISELHGSTYDDRVGSDGVTTLSNGNFLVKTQSWDNGATINVGAVTWGSGITGVSGVVSAANSLIGSTANDRVGTGRVLALSDGNYVVGSASWDNGSASSAGAVTWGNGSTGICGVVSEANSLVGSRTDDRVGNAITALANGNFVVACPTWDNGVLADAGSVTWGNGTTGIIGPITAANSLIGSVAGDQVGYRMTALENGNYVVSSPFWDNGSLANAGAATWGSGTGGIIGTISVSNSLVGDKSGDQVGYGVTALKNGNYVVTSQYWDKGTVADVGAVTWCNGTSGNAGVVGLSNSLVGSSANDWIGNSVTELANGNYLVSSSFWSNAGVASVGAVTWLSGAAGTSGVVSPANSLVGSTANDRVGTVIPLKNGNYVVECSLWDNGAVADAGAVTWSSGTAGITGVVSAANSLVGSTAGDQVGLRAVYTLSNGNYVVGTPRWDNGVVGNAGAVTWGNGSTGISGPITPANSLVGSKANDGVGSGVIRLTNSNFVVRSPDWDNGAVTDVGAVTWVSGTAGISGPVTSNNSLVGSTAGDGVGDLVTPLGNGNYAICSPAWDNGAMPNVGAVTWGNGTTGISGTVAVSNSVIGLTANTNLQLAVADNINGTYFCRFLAEAGGIVRVVSQADGLSAPAAIGVLEGARKLADGNLEPVAFGATPVGVGLNKTFTIVNSGGADLVIGGIGKDGTNAAEFVVGAPVNSTVPPGGSTTFTIAFNPAATGVRTAAIHIVSNVGSPMDSFDIVFAGAGQPTFGQWAENAGLSGADAAGSATPFGEGVENLLKYAFNLDGSRSDARVLTVGGNSGLPLIELDIDGAQPVLRVVYVRRIGSGLIYTPKTSTTLDGFVPMTGNTVVTPIDSLWERVTVEQASPPATIPSNFARVEVTQP